MTVEIYHRLPSRQACPPRKLVGLPSLSDSLRPPPALDKWDLWLSPPRDKYVSSVGSVTAPLQGLG